MGSALRVRVRRVRSGERSRTPSPFLTSRQGAANMALRIQLAVIVSCAAVIGFAPSTSRAAEPITKPAKITLDEAGALVVDGKKVFPITLTIVPGPEAKAPSGRHAYE